MNALIRYLIWKFFMRHPVLGGITFTLVGFFAISLAFDEGARYAEFEGGARVAGRVVNVRYDAGRTPTHAAEVAWIADGVIHRGLAEVLGSRVATANNPNPERPLRPGSELRLVVSKKDPEKVISAEVLSAPDRVNLAGKPAMSNLLLIGLLFIGLGVVCVLLRHRMTAARAA